MPFCCSGSVLSFVAQSLRCCQRHSTGEAPAVGPPVWKSSHTLRVKIILDQPYAMLIFRACIHIVDKELKVDTFGHSSARRSVSLFVCLSVCLSVSVSLYLLLKPLLYVCAFF